MARRKEQLRSNTFVNTTETSNRFNGVTVGKVVDTNDPQQMGRVRALVPGLGDLPETLLCDLPWCSYVAPFAGTTRTGTRGPDDSDASLSEGPVAYGMWAIPKIGAQVLVMCLDGDPKYRVWVGCLHQQFQTHTMPHGRFSYKAEDTDDGVILDDQQVGGSPGGPFTTEEYPIQPMHTNYEAAFGRDRKTNHEWRTRGADFSASAIDTAVSESDALSFVADDKDVEFEDKKYRQGYETSRHLPDLGSDLEGGGYYDSTVYSVVSPGFHAFSMDDRKENCRVRLRTTAGNQIILDDTNERIFISTATGKSWIEMDQQGNIDVHSEGRVSMHATKDINFTTDKSFRVKAKEGIHLQSETDVRVHAVNDVNIRSTNNVRLHSGISTHVSAGANIYMLGANIHQHANGGGLKIKTTASVNILAGQNIIQTGAAIHMNGPAAEPAEDAVPVDNLYAYATNRVPFNLAPGTEDMWPRTCLSPAHTDSDNQPNADTDYYWQGAQEWISYDDPAIGREELEEKIQRGPYWRR